MIERATPHGTLAGKARRRAKRRLFAALMTGSALTLPGAAMAQSWDGSESADFNAPGNWSNNAVPNDATSVTVATDTNAPVIEEGQTGLARSMAVGAFDGASLTVRAGGILRIGTPANGGGLTVAGSNTGNGTVRATGAGSSITVNGNLSVATGQNSRGLVEILDGAQLSSRAGEFGAAAGSSGTVTVSGAGSRWDVIGTGNGGMFLGSLANTTARSTLNVLDGAAVVFAGPNDSLNAINGSAVNVIGANSLLRLPGALTSRNGTFTVASGGLAEADSLRIDGFTGLPEALVSVDGGQIRINRGVTIGSFSDSTGQLSIANGGVLRAGSLLIGFGNRSRGQLNVDGAGSLFELTSNSAIDIGTTSNNPGGGGDITISNGGRFVGNTSRFDLRRGSSLLVSGQDSTFGHLGELRVGGTVTITGPGALATGNSLSVGQSVPSGVAPESVAPSLVEVLNGGTLRISQNVNLTNSNAVVRASGAGSTIEVGLPGGASVEIRSPGSRLEILDGAQFVGATNTAVRTVGGLRISGRGTDASFGNSVTVSTGSAALADAGLVVENNGIFRANNLSVAASTAGPEAGSIIVRSGGQVIARDIVLSGNFLGGPRSVLLIDGGSVTADSIGSISNTRNEIILGGAADSAPGTVGTFDVDAVNLLNTDFVINHTGTDLVLNSRFGGSSSVIRHLAGTTTLTGLENFSVNAPGSYQGETLLTGGTLRVNGSFGNVVHVMSVSNGATLGGTGRIGGNVTIADGRLAPGVGVGTLTFGNNLVLRADSTLAFDLGAPDGIEGTDGDLITVLGNLTLDGTLNVRDAGGFGGGLYRLINYTGTLTDSELAIGATPAGFAASDLSVVTATARQVNLLVGTPSGDFSFWDGANTVSNNLIDGGSGIWRAASTNWSLSDGTRNGNYNPSALLIFAGTPGRVTVDNASGPVSLANGLQFAVSGYTVAGGNIALGNNPIVLRVGDGTADGADFTATIAANLTGGASIEKTDLGRLIITGSLAPTSGTTISHGTLQIGARSTTGTIAGDILNNAALVFNRSGLVDYAGVISGTGTLEQRGPGTLTLSGNNSYTGRTTVAGGTLVNTGTIAGATTILAVGRLTNTGTLGGVTNSGNSSNSGTMGALTNRAGSFTNNGVLNGNITNRAGATFATTATVNGTLTNNGTARIAGALNGALDNRAGSVTLTGPTTVITAFTQGSGASLDLAGFDLTTGWLTGDGTVQLGTGTLTTGGESEAAPFSGSIVGTGGLVIDRGTLTLTGNNTFTGPTTVSGGTLVNTGQIAGATIVQENGGLRNSGTLAAVTNSGTGTNFGTMGSLTNLAGSFRNDGDLNGAVINSAGASFVSSFGTVNGSLTNYGTVSMSGTLIGALDNRAGSVLLVGRNPGITSITQAAGATFTLGAAVTTGSLSGDGEIQLGGSLTTGGDNADTVFAGIISGSGDLVKNGTGQFTLSGANTFAGRALVEAGSLNVTGSIAGLVRLEDGAALTGNGRIGDSVFVRGGVLAPGGIDEVGTLSVGSLLLAANSALTYRLGAPDLGAGVGSDFIRIGNANAPGDLRLDGTLNIVDAGGFGPGLYRLMDYTGTLTNNGLAIGTVPDGTVATDLNIVTAVPSQINLLYRSPALTLNFWDGQGTTPDGVIGGGTGQWSSIDTNWTDATGTFNGIYDPDNFLIFSGTPSFSNFVIVNDFLAPVVLGAGVQFAVSDYSLGGDDITVRAGSSIVRVGDGTAAASAISARISSNIVGPGTIVKTDLGRLTLSGQNSFGGLTIQNGVVQLEGLGTPGNGLITINDGSTLEFRNITPPAGANITAFDNPIATSGNALIRASGRQQSVALTGAISGDGSITANVFELILSGNNTHNGLIVQGGVIIGSSTAAGRGGITLDGGSLRLLPGVQSIDNAITLTRDSGLRSDGHDITFNGDISGNHAISTSGDGVISLNGDVSVRRMLIDGNTVRFGGTVSVADINTTTFSNIELRFGGTVQSGASSVAINHRLLINSLGRFDVRDDELLSINGSIDALNGQVVKSGLGTLALNDVVSVRNFEIREGTLQVGNGARFVRSDAEWRFAAGTTLQSGAAAVTLGSRVVLSGDTSVDVRDGEALTLAVVRGSGSLTKTGGGVLNLSAQTSHTGGTVVNAGTLNLARGLTRLTLVDAVDLSQGGTLSGTGGAGAVTVGKGTLAPGFVGGGPGTLWLDSLVLADRSTLNFDFTTPNSGSATDFISIAGNLTLDGTLNVADRGGFGAGLYGLLSYTGTLTDNGLLIGTVPRGFLAEDLSIVTSTPRQVNLLVAPPVGNFTFWDGEGPAGNTKIDGGSGTWSAVSRNWTTADGSSNGPYTPEQLLLFAGTPGTVTVDNTAGDVSVSSGVQFASDGYRVVGGALTLDAPITTIRVGDGTNAGVATVATIDSALTGAGGLTKTDRGTLVLTGNNTFAGGLEVATGGTVLLGSNAAAGTGMIRLAGADSTLGSRGTSISVANDISLGTGSRFLVSGGETLTLTGALTDETPSTFLKSGGGTLVLAGTNNTIRGLDVKEGILRISNADAAGSGVIFLDAGSTLQSGGANIALRNGVTVINSTIDVRTGETLSLAGFLTMATGSRVLKTGQGTLVLNNRFNNISALHVSGGTLRFAASLERAAGVLRLGGGTTLQSGGAAITLSFRDIIASGKAEINVRPREVLTLDGFISGTASLTKTGTGTLVLGRANRVTGSLEIDAGGVIGAANSLGFNSIVNAGVLQIDQRTTGSLAAILSGNGILNKSGGSTLTLSAISPFAGRTVIDQGKLVVTGSLSRSAVTVRSGAFLGGTGRVGQLVVERGGRVAPGLSPGTLTVDGDFDLQAGAVYEAEFSTTGQDLIVVNGTANIAGDLELIPLGGFSTFNTELTLISANATTGSFANVIGLDRFGEAFAPVLTGNGSALTLRLAPAALSTKLSGVSGGNALAVASALDRAVAGGYNPQDLVALYHQGANLSAALGQLAGEVHSANRRVLLQDARTVREAAFDRLTAGISVLGDEAVTADDGGRRVTAWQRIARSGGTAQASGTASRVTTDQTAFMTGFDITGNGFRAGAMFHHGESELRFGGSDNARLLNTGGAVYAGWRQDNGLSIGGGGSIAGNSARTIRSVRLPGLDQTLGSRVKGTTYQLFGEAAYDLAPADAMDIAPFVRLAYTKVDTGALAETGGTTALAARAQAASLTQTSTGLRAAYTGKSAALSGSASWQRSSGDRGGATELGFAGTGAAAQIVAAALDRDMLALDLQARIALSSAVTFGAGYNGLIGRDNAEHGARATLTIGF